MCVWGGGTRLFGKGVTVCAAHGRMLDRPDARLPRGGRSQKERAKEEVSAPRQRRQRVAVPILPRGQSVAAGVGSRAFNSVSSGHGAHGLTYGEPTGVTGSRHSFQRAAKSALLVTRGDQVRTTGGRGALAALTRPGRGGPVVKIQGAHPVPGGWGVHWACIARPGQAQSMKIFRVQPLLRCELVFGGPYRYLPAW